MLCTKALISYNKYGVYNASYGVKVNQRGMMIPYESLPGALVSIVLPLFRIFNISSTWLSSMKKSTKFYSKSRVKSNFYKDDSELKNKQASKILKKWALNILESSYIRLRNSSRIALNNLLLSNLVNPYLNFLLDAKISTWKSVANLPSTT